MDELSHETAMAVFEASESVIKAATLVRTERPDAEEASDWTVVKDALAEEADHVTAFRKAEAATE